MDTKIFNLYSGLESINPKQEELLAEGKNPYLKNTTTEESTEESKKESTKGSYTLISKTLFQSSSENRPKMK